MPARPIVSLLKIQRILTEASDPLQEIVDTSAELDAQQIAIEKLNKNPNDSKLAAARAQFEQTRKTVSAISGSVNGYRTELDRELKMFQRFIGDEKFEDRRAEDEVAKFVRSIKALSRALKEVAKRMPD